MIPGDQPNLYLQCLHKTVDQDDTARNESSHLDLLCLSSIMLDVKPYELNLFGNLHTRVIKFVMLKHLH